MLADKIVIVTGGCSGIGWGITQKCVREGATVIAGQRSESGKDRIDELVEQGFDAHFKCLDVSKPESINAFVSAVYAEHGRVDALVNNAGITIEEDFFEMPLEKLDMLWATNQRSVFLMSQAVARHMREQGGGSILNISSNHSYGSVPGYEMYAATKGGIAAMTRAMSWSLGKYGIRVNTLSPGLTMTEGVQNVLVDKPELERPFRDMHATGEVSTVEDIANAASFLISDQAKAFAGADILADQGVAALLVPQDRLV